MAQGEFRFSDPPPGPQSFKRSADFFSPDSDKTSQDQPPSAPPPQSTPLPTPEIFSVTQLTRLIKLTLSDRLPAKIILEAEISNFKKHDSGHLYLTLKDDNAQITAVMWKTAAARLKFRPADGLAVIATGRIDVYEPQGKYQFYIDKLEPAGLGALELAFRQLAEKLRRAGLFEQKHKKPIPPYPRTIAIVTSPTGAAIRDIEKTLHRRCPIVRKLLFPVAVQGEAAPAQIAAAIEAINRRQAEWDGVDLIIVGRGGGSIEDLWAFNDEAVAHAIFASKIPIISAVGHESDTTIADLVADQRAATPTAAAELAAPVLTDLLAHLQQTQNRLLYAWQRRYETAAASLIAIEARSLFSRPLDIIYQQQQILDHKSSLLAQATGDRLRAAARHLENYSVILKRIEPHAALTRSHARLAEINSRFAAAHPRHYARRLETEITHLAHRFDKALEHLTWRRRSQLDAYRQRLENLNPRAVLNRGYSITREKTSGHILDPQTTLNPGDRLTTELAQRRIIESEVTSTQPKEK